MVSVIIGPNKWTTSHHRNLYKIEFLSNYVVNRQNCWTANWWGIWKCTGRESMKMRVIMTMDSLLHRLHIQASFQNNGTIIRNFFRNLKKQRIPPKMTLLCLLGALRIKGRRVSLRLVSMMQPAQKRAHGHYDTVSFAGRRFRFIGEWRKVMFLDFFTGVSSLLIFPG